MAVHVHIIEGILYLIADVPCLSYPFVCLKFVEEANWRFLWLIFNENLLLFDKSLDWFFELADLSLEQIGHHLVQLLHYNKKLQFGLLGDYGSRSSVHFRLPWLSRDGARSPRCEYEDIPNILCDWVHLFSCILPAPCTRPSCSLFMWSVWRSLFLTPGCFSVFQPVMLLYSIAMAQSIIFIRFLASSPAIVTVSSFYRIVPFSFSRLSSWNLQWSPHSYIFFIWWLGHHGVQLPRQQS